MILQTLGENMPEIKAIPYKPEEAPKELLALLYELDPDGIVISTKHDFHFAVSPLFTKKRIVNLHGTLYHGRKHQEVEREIFEGIKEKKFKSESERVIALLVLASEYKIHLMPKPEYILSVVQLIVRACKKNPILLSLIHTIKINGKPLSFGTKIDADKVLPHIVIYLKLGKRSAERALKLIYEVFSDVDTQKIGMGIPARYSQPINALISYAQSGGDTKNIMTESQITYYFSQSKVHCNLPFQHLKNPVIADLECLESVLAEISSIKDFKLQKTTLSTDVDNVASVSLPLPHVSLWFNFKKVNNEPMLLGENDKKLIDKLYARVLIPFGINTIRTKWINDNFLLRIYLPGNVNIVRHPSFRMKFLEKLFNQFLEPYESFILMPLLDNKDTENGDDVEMAKSAMDTSVKPQSKTEKDIKTETETETETEQEQETETEYRPKQSTLTRGNPLQLRILLAAEIKKETEKLEQSRAMTNRKS